MNTLHGALQIGIRRVRRDPRIVRRWILFDWHRKVFACSQWSRSLQWSTVWSEKWIILVHRTGNDSVPYVPRRSLWTCDIRSLPPDRCHWFCSLNTISRRRQECSVSLRKPKGASTKYSHHVSMSRQYYSERPIVDWNGPTVDRTWTQFSDQLQTRMLRRRSRWCNVRSACRFLLRVGKHNEHELRSADVYQLDCCPMELFAWHSRDERSSCRCPLKIDLTDLLVRDSSETTIVDENRDCWFDRG